MSADFCFLLPRLLALPTEAWRGAEIRRLSAENVFVDLPGPWELYGQHQKLKQFV
jgi:hypothetical protein